MATTKAKVPELPGVLGLSVRQAEEALGLPLGVGYRKIKEGRLRAFKSNGLLKVTPDEIFRFQREET